MPQQPIVLPADVYDTLELSALAFGGVGHNLYTEIVNADGGGYDFVPCCIVGHGKSADNHTYQLGRILRDAGIDEGFNDALVKKALRAGAGNKRTRRISWAEYTKRGNIVRGTDVTEETNS